MAEKHPTPTQLKALRLALPTGTMCRFAGGYWVASDHPPKMSAYLGHDNWVGTTTVRACTDRGWMCWPDGDWKRAAITDAGRAALKKAGA